VDVGGDDVGGDDVGVVLVMVMIGRREKMKN
jgi:hypothetical protein